MWDGFRGNACIVRIMAGSIFIGAIIERELRARRMTVKDFASALGVQRPNAYRIFQSHSIDTDLLLRISSLLEHDFFHDYSNYLTTTQQGGQ